MVDDDIVITLRPLNHAFLGFFFYRNYLAWFNKSMMKHFCTPNIRTAHCDNVWHTGPVNSL